MLTNSTQSYNKDYARRRKKQRNIVYGYTYMIGVLSMEFFKKGFTTIFNLFHNIIITSGEKISKKVKKTISYLKRQLFAFVNMFRKVNYAHEKNKVAYRASGKSSYSIPLYSKLLVNILKIFLVIVNNILKIVFPLVAVYGLIFTVSYFGEIKLGVNVRVPSSDGGYVDLGYVEDESIFRIAQKAVLEDIKYEESGDELIYTIPIFTIEPVADRKLINSSELRNEIIKAISKEVEEAYGLYVDGVFLGAVEDPTKLKETLENLKDAHKTGVEGEKVDFLQEVKIEDNIYLVSGIKDESEIIKLLTNPQEIEQQYVVKSGDTPSGVAEELGIKYEELKGLNADISDNFIPGKTLVTKGEKTFLAIKKTSIVRYEETIPFKNEVIADDSSSVGSYKIAQEGEEGLVEIMTEITTVDGVQIEQIEVGRTTLLEAINEEKLVGTRTYINGEIVHVDPNSQELGSGTFVWPTQTRGNVTNYTGRGHMALDIQSYYGDNILASDGGVVVIVNYSRYGYGYEVVVDHLNGYQTRYAHNSKILVKVGDFVKQGQPIALQGNTGNVRGRTGIHLHFEIIKNGVKLNPRKFF